MGAVDEGFFLFSAPALYLFFSVKGFVDSLVFFVIYQLYRASYLGVVGSFSALMLLETVLLICCAAGVVIAV